MAGEGGVVGLEVQFQVFEQAVLAEKIQTSRGVRIVLVLGRFLRFGLDVERALKAQLAFVIHREAQKSR